MNNVDLSQLAIERPVGLPSRRRRSHVVTRYILPGLLIAGFMGVATWASRDLVFPAKPVTVVPVFSTQTEQRQAGMPLFNAAGWIEPRPTPVRVAALAPGVIEKLLVVEDQPVTAGEPIAELVKDDAKLACDAAQADLRLRQAELDEARAALTAATTRFEQPVHLQAALSEAEALLTKLQTMLTNLPFELKRAQAELDVARIDFAGKTAAKDVVAKVEIDRAHSVLDSAQALVGELKTREASLHAERNALILRRDSLKTKLELLADEIQDKDQAQAKVEGALARVEQAAVAAAEAQLRLDRMTVRAPIDGRVYHLIGQPGSNIGGGMTQMVGHDGSTVVTLYRPGVLQARVDVRFEDIQQVQLGQPVNINNPALTAPLTGKVLFVSSEADIQKNTLQVKVEIVDPPPVFKPEMLVDVTFLAPEPTGKRTTTQALRLYLPGNLVQQSGDGAFVWLADQSAGIARKTPVQTGPELPSGLVEITSGLTIASRIIVGGGDGLEDGDRIRVTGEATTNWEDDE